MCRRFQNLPENFVQVAHAVMRVLNNVARLDLVAAQQLLTSTNNRCACGPLISAPPVMAIISAVHLPFL